MQSLTDDIAQHQMKKMLRKSKAKLNKRSASHWHEKENKQETLD